jgi:hypothetical protein
VELEVEMLGNIGDALTEHSVECCQNPKAILLNPGNHALIGWDEAFGLPVLPDERVGPKRFKLVCGDRGWGGLYEGEPVWWTSDGAAHRRAGESENEEAKEVG